MYSSLCSTIATKIKFDLFITIAITITPSLSLRLQSSAVLHDKHKARLQRCRPMSVSIYRHGSLLALVEMLALLVHGFYLNHAYTFFICKLCTCYSKITSKSRKHTKMYVYLWPIKVKLNSDVYRVHFKLVVKFELIINKTHFLSKQCH